MLRLKLGYRRVRGPDYEVWIAEQDEDLRNTDTMVSANNDTTLCETHGWVVKSVARFQIASNNTLYIRGYSRSQDDKKQDSNRQELEELARVVASFNNRKNVCEIGDEGFIY